MISVENLSKKFKNITAVDEISFEISPRKVTGFLGPNGAGKTTTLRMLTGFLTPTCGNIKIRDMDISENPLECKKIIGYLPENNPLYEDMDVFEFLRWSARMYNIPLTKQKQAIDSAIEKCALNSVIGQDIGHLSRGFRQRVGLAKAILHDPDILLLDEPTSGLDPNQSQEVRTLLTELKKEKTVLLSTHILSEVQAICDNVIIINKGKIAAQGRTEELVTNYSNEQKVIMVLSPSEDKNLREKIMKIDGVSFVSKTSNETEEIYTISAPAGTDIRNKLYALCVEEKLPLLELYRQTVSLEEIFKNLTQ